MALRKASAYSKKKTRPYTRRSGVTKQAYVKTVPPSKIVKFITGDQQAFDRGKHTHIVRLIASEKVQIRDNALESCRMYITKTLDNEIPGSYFFSVKVHPHHILRENKTAAGAGADRLSSGMKHSFGVTIGRAAIVPEGKEIFVVSCATERAARAARDVFQKIKSKVPCKTKIMFERIGS